MLSKCISNVIVKVIITAKRRAVRPVPCALSLATGRFSCRCIFHIFVFLSVVLSLFFIRRRNPGMRRIIVVNTLIVEMFRPLEVPLSSILHGFLHYRWCFVWICRRRTVDAIKRRRRRAFVLLCREVRGFILEIFCYFVPINICYN